MKIVKTAFCIDDSKHFEGYTERKYWNGWECPYFTKDVGKEVIKMAVGENDDTTAYYDKNIDAFIVVFYATSNEPDTEVYKAEFIEYEGKKIKVYPIGYGCWCWDDANKY